MMPNRDRQLRDHAATEFRKSLLLKTLFVGVSIFALGLIVLLDSMKKQFIDTKRQPYSHKSIVEVLKAKGAPQELLAAAGTPRLAGRNYATVEEAFNVIVQHTAAENTLRDETTRITGRYDPSIRAANTAIEALLALEEKPKTFKDDLAAQVALRTSLVNARMAELTEAQQTAGAERARLKWSYDNIDVASAKSEYVFFEKKKVDAVAVRIVDGEDPLSVIYDVLWYGALIVGVFTLAALVLSPVFRAVPLTGADDTLAERLKNLVNFAPRAMRAASGIAAAAVGTVAVVGAAAALPSSPINDPVRTESGYEQPKDKGHPEEAVTSTAVTDTAPPGGTTTAGGTDPLAGLREEIKQLRDAITAHDGKSPGSNPPPIDPDALARRVGGQVGDRFTRLETTLTERHEQISAQVGTTQTTIAEKVVPAVEHTDLLVDSIDTGVKSIDRNVNTAGTTIDTRASGIEVVALLPQQLGERPSAVASFLGFDRYQVTAASTTALDKLGAPPEVKTAVGSLGGTLHTNDGVRRILREKLCTRADPKCEPYRTWINPVLRVTRAN